MTTNNQARMMEMERTEVRLECLRLAQQKGGPSAKDIVDTARVFGEFVLETEDGKVAKAAREFFTAVGDSEV